jgi:LmbE family N-acetylglucosaminyl deacetylase
MAKRVFAIAAHPDDIEFLMAGTLILLRDAGWEAHYMNLANGSCGTSTLAAEEIVRIRGDEARNAAASIGAVFHEPVAADIEIFYEKPLLAKVAAVIREVAPDILLTHSPADYMEDHQNAARLAATAAFVRGMRNFPTDPPRGPVSGEVAVYHAQPHGNCDALGRPVRPGLFVDIRGVLGRKREMLAHHESQKAWLDETQGLDSYLAAMEEAARAVGEMSGRFEYAEGWRRRSHLGFCAEDADPLGDALGERVARDRRTGN